MRRARLWPVGLVGAREAARPHFGGIGLGRLADPLGEVVVALHEARRALEHPEHVVGDQDLAVARRRCADADHRRSDVFRHLGRKLFHHAFDDDGECAGLGDRARVVQDLVRLDLLAAARAIAPEDVHSLRGEADMADHRDSALGQQPDGRRHRFAALELDRRAAGLLHHPRAACERLLGRALIASERHVDRDQGVPASAHHRRAVRAHHVERDGDGRGKAVDHLAKAVADQQHVAMRVEQLRHAHRVGGQRDDRLFRLAVGLSPAKRRDGHALAGDRGRGRPAGRRVDGEGRHGRRL